MSTGNFKNPNILKYDIIYKQIYICGVLCKFRFGCLYYFMRLYGKKCLRIYIEMLFSAKLRYYTAASPEPPRSK